MHLLKATEKSSFSILAVAVVVLLAVAFLALVTPNGSYTSNWLNDVMGLIDGAYRTYLGQVPSVDFQSIYGVAIYFPAALGFHFGLNASGVLAFGHFVVAALLLPLAAISSYRRFAILPSLILLLFLFLLIVAPIQMGGHYFNQTFGVFYNRHCYAALAIVLLHYVEPRTIRRPDLYLDSTVLTLLFLFLLYSKVTFAAAALAFLVASAMTSRWKLKTAITSMALAAAVIAAVSILTEYNSAYLADIMSASQQKARLWSGVYAWVDTLYADVGSVTTALLSLAALFLFGRRSFFDAAFAAGTIIVSFILGDFAVGGLVGFPLLIAVFLNSGELARRTHSANAAHPAKGGLTDSASLFILGALMIFVSEPIMGNSIALYSHYRTVKRQESSPLPGLAGFVVPPPNDGSGIDYLHRQLGHDEEGHILLARLRQLPMRAGEYWALIVEGCRLLERIPLENRSLVTFEQSNAFNATMKLKPTPYGFPLFWQGLAFSPDKHPAPERFFSNADFVMVPVVPYDPDHLEAVQAVYGSYLKENFEETEKSAHWTLWTRKAEGVPAP